MKLSKIEMVKKNNKNQSNRQKILEDLISNLKLFQDKPGIEPHTFNYSTQEAEASRSL